LSGEFYRRFAIETVSDEVSGLPHHALGLETVVKHEGSGE
jgi:hypothetical protein